jgi:hypothetical protein
MLMAWSVVFFLPGVTLRLLSTFVAAGSQSDFPKASMMYFVVLVVTVGKFAWCFGCSAALFEDLLRLHILRHNSRFQKL